VLLENVCLQDVIRRRALVAILADQPLLEHLGRHELADLQIELFSPASSINGMLGGPVVPLA